MPGAPPLIIGPPGTRWQNETSRILWQFRCAFYRSCGRCMALHGSIAHYFYLPIHDHCRCTAVPFAPGELAPLRFTDFRQTLDSLPLPQRFKAVGTSNYKLIRKGLVGWQDVVTPDRVRGLAEVVAANRLTLAALLAAGIRGDIARRAYDESHLPSHVHDERHYRSLVERVTTAHAAHHDLFTRLERASGVRPSTETAVSPVTRAAHAAALGVLLAAPPRRRMLAAEEHHVVAESLGEPAAASVATFLAAVETRMGDGEPVGETLQRLYRKYR